MEYTTKEMSYDASSGEGRIFARGFAPADKMRSGGFSRSLTVWRNTASGMKVSPNTWWRRDLWFVSTTMRGMENRRWMRRALVILVREAIRIW